MKIVRGNQILYMLFDAKYYFHNSKKQIQALASIMLINSKSSYDKNPSSAHLQQSSRTTKNLKLVFSGAV